MSIEAHTLHDERELRPSWLVDGAVGDHIWQVATDNPKLYRRASVTIRFAVPVGYGGLLLTDAAAHNDLLTAKSLLVAGLSGEERWLGSGASAQGFYGRLLNFFRWRRGSGITRTADLSPAWLDRYLDQIASGGPDGLLDTNRRVRSAIADLGSQAEQLIRRSPWYPFDLYDVNKLLRFAGLSSSHQLSDDARAAIVEHAAELGLELHHRPALRALALGHAATHKTGGSDLAVLTLNGRLQVWERLWRHREVLSHDPLPFAPFKEGSSAYKVARTMSVRRTDKVPTPPAEQTCFLIDRALRWVLHYANPLMALGDELRRNREGFSYKTPHKARREILRNSIDLLTKELSLEGPAAPWPLLRNGYRARDRLDGISVRSALFEYLPAACAIIIAAFTARRAGEIESLRRGCIGETPNGYVLECYIEKSLRTIDQIPAPAVVAQAVKVLEWISQEAEAESGWLFAFRELMRSDLGHTPEVSIDLRRCLPAFVNYVGVPPLQSGEQWSFTPHQFRRFFAVTYYYRFKNRSLDALSHFLKHSNVDVTRGYVTEVTPGSFLRVIEEERVQDSARAREAIRSAMDRKQDFDAVSREFREERFAAVARGLEPIGGFGGARLGRELSALVEDVRAQIRLGGGDSSGEDQAINRAIAELAARTALDPHPDGHSYCSCTEDASAVAVASCAAIAGAHGHDLGRPQVPDHRYASDLVCAGCPHNVQFAENVEYWTRVAGCQVLGEAETPFHERQKERVEAARNVLASVQSRACL